jgi:hypothetical protein
MVFLGKNEQHPAMRSAILFNETLLGSLFLGNCAGDEEERSINRDVINLDVGNELGDSFFYAENLFFRIGLVTLNKQLHCLFGFKPFQDKSNPFVQIQTLLFPSSFDVISIDEVLILGKYGLLDTDHPPSFS